MTNFLTKWGKAAAVLLVALGAQQAHAAGTASGTDVANTATINYKVGGVDQTPVPASVTFKVDRKITLTVAEVGGTATGPVAPGQANQVTTFTVTNTSNATLDFGLGGANVTGTTAHGGTENQDMENIRVFVESGATAGYQSGEDTAIFIDELAADQSKTVYIVANVPAAATNGQIATVALTATAKESGVAATEGAVVTQTAGADTAGAVDTVFGDGTGPGAGDAARDGKHSDDDDYSISSTALSVLKTSKVISDPFNNTTNPKAIPGAVVEYCIIVTNPGAQAATLVTLVDNLPSTLVDYNVGSMLSAVTVTGGNTCDSATGTAEDDNSTDADDTDGFSANFDAGNNRVNAVIATLAASGTNALRFRVTVK